MSTPRFSRKPKHPLKRIWKRLYIYGNAYLHVSSVDRSERSVYVGISAGPVEGRGRHGQVLVAGSFPALLLLLLVVGSWGSEVAADQV